MKKITRKELITARFEVTQFFKELSAEDKQHALKALRYAMIIGNDQAVLNEFYQQ